MAELAATLSLGRWWRTREVAADGRPGGQGAIEFLDQSGQVISTIEH